MYLEELAADLDGSVSDEHPAPPAPAPAPTPVAPSSSAPSSGERPDWLGLNVTQVAAFGPDQAA